MSYKVTVRAGSRVEHEHRETLDDALALLEARGRELGGERAPATDALGRRYEAADQVIARIELNGPDAKGGVDVRGDGTVEAWTGRFVRRPIQSGHPYDALRQQLKE